MQYYEILFPIGAVLFVAALISALLTILYRNDGVPLYPLGSELLSRPDLLTESGQISRTIYRVTMIGAMLIIGSAVALGACQVNGFLPWR